MSAAVALAALPAPTAARPRRCGIVHLGLGNFFRAHQAWYTDRAPTPPTGASPRSPAARPRLADALDRPGRPVHADHPRRRRRPLRGRRQPRRAAHAGRPTTTPGCDYLRRPEVARRHHHRHRGRLPAAAPTAASTPTAPTVQADLAALRADPRRSCAPRPARLVAGLAARRARRRRAARRRVRATTCPTTARSPRGVVARPRRRCVDPDAGRLDRRERRRSSPRWSTGSPRDHRPTTTAPSVAADRPSTTPRRSSPSRSASGCSAARSRPAGPRWEDAGAHVRRRRRPRSSSASCGCSTARTRCSPTPAASAATRPSPRRRRPDVPRLGRAVVGRGRPASAAARRRGRRLPRGAARAVRQPAHPAPAGPDRRRRLAEAAGPDPAGAARRAGRRPAARRRVRVARRLDRATCAAPARRSTTPRADDVVPLAAGPLAEAVRRVADAARPRPRRRHRAPVARSADAVDER